VRLLKRIGLVITLLMIGAFMAGLFLFASKVAGTPPDDQQPADGIVALTGGSSRISDAMKLLADGRGKRLLVTGLNPSTSRHDLARTMGNKSYLVECCVDLDYQAVNTIGNAVEAFEWAKKNNFTKLVIVTSNYHMPRTLLELHRVFPEGVFIPHVVESPSVEIKNWWMHLPTLRLLLSEYVKYLAAQARPSFVAMQGLN
jgi:uncharacterized SAM-binding protein YcdF (DUF218 family)